MTGWLLAFVAPILCGSTVATILCTRFPRTMLPTDPNEYWFPAKRYGWGWGLPSRWQGWVVLAIYAVLLVVGIIGLHPGTTQSSFVVYVAGVTALLVLVCWWKGEPPRWRWGRD